MLFRIGLNPYGLAYTVGLQGAGTPRANPAPIGMRGFLQLVSEFKLRSIELHGAWLDGASDDDLVRLRRECEASSVTPIVSAGLPREPGETLERPIHVAASIGAPLVRLHLTPVLEGAREKWGSRWSDMVRHAAATLPIEARRAESRASAGIEDHQDFGSRLAVARRPVGTSASS